MSASPARDAPGAAVSLSRPRQSNAAAKRNASVRREQEMKFGTQITADGVRFRLWAPDAGAVSLKLFAPPKVLPMKQLARGWFELEAEGVRPGDRYMFVLGDGTEVPDPASRYQPDDVHGPSEVVDPLAFEWTDRGWAGRPWEEAVIYQLHVGTFTPQGTFRAAAERLDYLRELGVTAIQLMPIADFEGRWNWGYDGALLFAPDASYGRPEDLKALVNAAHAHGLMVFLDVVYNHFGPEGNYLPIYAPLLSERHHTPWGPALNFDDHGAGMIRGLVQANARYWLNEFRFDGLRFDAVHAIQDTGPKHLLQELAEQIRAATDGRHTHLILENSDNQAGWLKRRDDGTPWLYTAQWADDIHHVLHTAATGERQWYYADYAGRLDLLGRALAEGAAWQGEYMEHEGRHRGEPSAYLPPTAFVSFIQNHDHVGNRPLGDRIRRLAPAQAVRTLAAIYLLAPQIPMLFMGEEWGSDQPFYFFSDIQNHADAIRVSRREELRLISVPEGVVPPDPMDEATYRASILDWSASEEETARDLSSLYRALLGVRRQRIVPLLHDAPGFGGRHEVLDGRAVRVCWQLAQDNELVLVVNLSDEPIEDIDTWSGLVWLEGTAEAGRLGPWSAVFALRHPGDAS